MNLLSDGFGCVVVDHLVKKGEKEDDSVGMRSSGAAYSHVEMGSLREDVG